MKLPEVLAVIWNLVNRLSLAQIVGASWLNAICYFVATNQLALVQLIDQVLPEDYFT